MPRPTKRPPAPPKRRTAPRPGGFRAAGLRPVQFWAHDTRLASFADKCRRQARAVAASDPAGDEIMQFVASVYVWPEP